MLICSHFTPSLLRRRERAAEIQRASGFETPDREVRPKRKKNVARAERRGLNVISLNTPSPLANQRQSRKKKAMAEKKETTDNLRRRALHTKDRKRKRSSETTAKKSRSVATDSNTSREGKSKRERVPSMQRSKHVRWATSLYSELIIRSGAPVNETTRASAFADRPDRNLRSILKHRHNPFDEDNTSERMQVARTRRENAEAWRDNIMTVCRSYVHAVREYTSTIKLRRTLIESALSPSTDDVHRNFEPQIVEASTKLDRLLKMSSITSDTLLTTATKATRRLHRHNFFVDAMQLSEAINVTRKEFGQSLQNGQDTMRRFKIDYAARRMMMVRRSAEEDDEEIKTVSYPAEDLDSIGPPKAVSSTAANETTTSGSIRDGGRRDAISTVDENVSYPAEDLDSIGPPKMTLSIETKDTMRVNSISNDVQQSFAKADTPSRFMEHVRDTDTLALKSNESTVTKDVTDATLLENSARMLATNSEAKSPTTTVSSRDISPPFPRHAKTYDKGAESAKESTTALSTVTPTFNPGENRVVTDDVHTRDERKSLGEIDTRAGHMSVELSSRTILLTKRCEQGEHEISKQDRNTEVAEASNSLMCCATPSMGAPKRTPGAAELQAKLTTFQTKLSTIQSESRTIVSDMTQRHAEHCRRRRADIEVRVKACRRSIQKAIASLNNSSSTLRIETDRALTDSMQNDPESGEEADIASDIEALLRQHRSTASKVRETINRNVTSICNMKRDASALIRESDHAHKEADEASRRGETGIAVIRRRSENRARQSALIRESDRAHKEAKRGTAEEDATVDRHMKFLEHFAQRVEHASMLGALIIATRQRQNVGKNRKNSMARWHTLDRLVTTVLLECALVQSNVRNVRCFLMLIVSVLTTTPRTNVTQFVGTVLLTTTKIQHRSASSSKKRVQ